MGEGSGVVKRSRPNIKAILGKDKNAYNRGDVHQSGQFWEKSWTQLKSRWNKIHPLVQKFNRCYKQADKHKRSGISENDLWVEHAWMLLKDEPKFDVSTGGDYSSSSNTKTPIEVKEYDTSSPMSFPIGQKPAKKKSKGKEASNTLNLSGIESLKEAQKSRLQEQEKCMEYEILMKDRSNLSKQQCQDRKNYCDHIRKKLGY
ncbi:hypothetical protein JHK82_048010 [Glycine max]|uniref:No apical meristem-associated C-terminal domain-containing protein n=1 Tax=Glycine max TaxID=3847 RepID=A0A0R0FN55_SOYBN|nr:hypothetical protein JHK86_047891 [Glycine max]KAG4933688.1 hypothetical protein JHK87_047690 [Glycine soja]KAG4943854.1 hypothetical protein JHK85_048500 [Glycine max]KAG5098156.1 hypothetical protein JHK82_048010 [Glycine max]KAG5102944.1 hypothetical protein JHK84_047913 [Glycine max]